MMKKERWTESELVSLPAGEQDYFERKSGAIMGDSDFHKKIAKAVSAFANSGGGHLIIGIRDDGSLDGVSRIHKGQTSTKDWLEQSIPDLVSYPLQNFRVHEVEPDVPSSIPTGKVVVVIDIGDSMLAPHQSTLTRVYYHRSGGRSEPAPHHFLEALRGREKYPSQKIAHAWLNFVIAPLLSTLRNEEKNLIHPKQPWGGYYMSTERLNYFKPLTENLSANDTQFLKSYPDIEAKLLDHDKAATGLKDTADRLVKTIAVSGFMQDAYSRFQSAEYLQRIREQSCGRVADNDERLRENLFGHRSEEKTCKALSEFIAYDYPQRDEEHFLWPVWRTYKLDLMEFLKHSPIRERYEDVNVAKGELLTHVKSLITLLEQRQHELAFQHGEPYEDSTLQRSWPDQFTSFE